MEVSKLSPVTKAIQEENLIFDFATNYYYKHPNQPDLKSFKLSESDFQSFKDFLSKSDFNFKTKTERAFQEAIEVAKEEGIKSGINADYQNLMKALNNYKAEAIETNKQQLINLLSEEIIKRYFYSEGLYEYYIANNAEIQTAKNIVNNPSKYLDYLK